MTLVRYACGYTAERYPQPFDVDSVQDTRSPAWSANAIAESQGSTTPCWRVCANANASRTMTLIARGLLHNLSVLEYMNGAPLARRASGRAAARQIPGSNGRWLLTHA